MQRRNYNKIFNFGENPLHIVAGFNHNIEMTKKVYNESLRIFKQEYGINSWSLMKLTPLHYAAKYNKNC